jgi:hypothetical protein
MTPRHAFRFGLLGSGALTYADAATEAPDFSTPNEAYWQGIDALPADLESRGLLAFVFPAYVGYAGNTNQGWMGEMVANGVDRMRAYGAFIARRYACRHNVVWMLGGDFGEFDARQAAVERALIDGLVQGAPGTPVKLRSAEWSSETIGTDHPEFGSLITLNGAYTFDGYTADHARRAYAVTPARPAFLLEEPYDEEAADGTNVNRRATRRCGASSGGAGWDRSAVSRHRRRAAERRAAHLPPARPQRGRRSRLGPSSSTRQRSERVRAGSRDGETQLSQERHRGAEARRTRGEKALLQGRRDSNQVLTP